VWTVVKVHSVEPVLRSFLVKSFNILFFFYCRRFLHYFISSSFFISLRHICFLLLKAPCSFINDKIYDISDFDFRALCVQVKKLIGEKVAHAYACVCCEQLIGEKVAHAYACVYCEQLIGEKVAHSYACVYCGQLIGEKVAHAYACVCVVGS